MFIKSRPVSALIQSGWFIFAALLLVCLFRMDPFLKRVGAAPQPTWRQAPSENPGRLAPKNPIEREINGTQRHSYQIGLQAGDFLEVVVEQKGINVVVSLSAPGGEKQVEMDTPFSTRTPESLLFLAEKAGEYQLTITPVDPNTPAAQYKAQIVSLRPSTQADMPRIAAQKAYLEGEHLRNQQTKASFLNALHKYEIAITHWRTAGDKHGEAQTLYSMGMINYILGDLQKALGLYEQILPLTQALGDQGKEAMARNDLGMVYSDLGNQPKALELYGQALGLERTVGDRVIESTTLSNLGVVYDAMGEKQKALEAYRHALVLQKELNDQRGQLYILNNLGALYDSMGEKQMALEHYQQALTVVRILGDRISEAGMLNNIGRAYSDLGEKQKALEYYSQSLPITHASGNQAGEAVTLSNIGLAYKDLGEPLKALEYFEQALALRRATSDRRGESYTVNHIGNVYNELGYQAKALEFFTQALSLSQAVQDRLGEAITFNNIGFVHSVSGEYSKALESHQKALPLFQAVGNRTGEAATLSALGSVYDHLKNQSKALEYFGQALPLRRAVGDRAGEALTLYSTAQTQRNTGQLTEAKASIEAALALVEQIRSDVASQELRASYLATVQNYYELYTDLLIQLHYQTPTAGFDKQALQASERARARSLLELLAESRVNFRQGVDPNLLARERDLKDRLTARLENLTKLLNQKHTDVQEAAAKKEIDTLTDQYQQIQVEIRQKSPRYAALTQPQPLTAEEIQTQVLDSDTMLLEFALGTDRSYVFCVTPTRLGVYQLPNRAEIEAAARQVRSLLVEPNRRITDETREARRLRLMQAEAAFPSAAKTLSEMILGPVRKELGTKRLLIVADGALQYVPFGVLPLPKGSGSPAAQPLIVTNEIVSLPSASTLAVIRKETQNRQPAARTLALLADPVFSPDDVRVKTETQSGINPPAPDDGALSEKSQLILERGFESGIDSSTTQTIPELNVKTAPVARERGKLRIPRLAFTRQEADQIAALVTQADVLKLLGFSVNRARVTDQELSHYRYVHFATHGFLDSERPELSALVLSMVDEKGQLQDGFLRGLEVYNLNLPAELVVLSACETGLGKSIKGEGLVGLTRGFMYAGTKRVVVSLWSVNDKATSELMVKMYRKMLKEGQRPAAALRAAQIELWKSKHWHAPFYWAPFILQGEWK